MSLSLAIMARNPIITVRAVIIMQNCYIYLWKKLDQLFQAVVYFPPGHLQFGDSSDTPI